jgi:hypothetical protein
MLVFSQGGSAPSLSLFLTLRMIQKAFPFDLCQEFRGYLCLLYTMSGGLSSRHSCCDFAIITAERIGAVVNHDLLRFERLRGGCAPDPERHRAHLFAVNSGAEPRSGG